MSEPLMWWGYLHLNGTVIVKRWFGDVKDYTDDARGNDFMKAVFEPFEAESTEAATRILVGKAKQVTKVKPG